MFPFLRKGPDIRETIGLISSTLTVILAALKYDNYIGISWFSVFAPLFAMDGILAYLNLIISVRLRYEKHLNASKMILILNLPSLLLFFVFKYLLAQKLENQTSISFTTIGVPLYIWSILAMIYFLIKLKEG